MALYDRLRAVEEPRIPVHFTIWALRDYNLGKITLSDVATALNLNASEQTEFTTLASKLTGALPALTYIELHYTLLACQFSPASLATTALLKTRIGV